MGQLEIDVSDKLLEEFRKMAHQVFGHSQGSLDLAFEEAVKDWLKQEGDKR